MVTLPVRQLDHYTTPGMPLTEMAGLLAAVAEDYPPTALTALLVDSLTKVLDLWADARSNGRPTIDLRDLDRAVTSEFRLLSAPGAPATPSHTPAWPTRPGPNPFRGEHHAHRRPHHRNPVRD
ncbi:hypothetical protein KIPE111705_05580 [Kibdelosporangium persicum]|uniref:hypothetical protein n=1 Tax=Kibdelosporangium persicum TaxID=2698649 RepID=UPI001566EFB1|nr:hypothetical protein [Kibdelosporangium persicum]